jgi:6-phosphogluconolactonase (cycloisomerase 2 family)
MQRFHQVQRGTIKAAILITLLFSLAALLLSGGAASRAEFISSSATARRHPTGSPQLVSIAPLPQEATADGAMCQWVPAGFTATSAPEQVPTAGHSSSTAVDAEPATTVNADRAPERTIRDTYPTYSAIAVDENDNEIFLEDENLFGIKVFNRTDNTPPNAAFTEPKRVIGGAKTKLEFNCGLYVDPKNGDVYSVNNDTVDTMAVFPHDAEGNVAPMRALHTPHRAYGVAVDEAAQELYLTIEHPPEVAVYHKMANGNDKPIRTISGEHTHLEDAHGIAIDTKNGWMFVSNHGATSGPWREGGWYDPPSITVYPLQSSGDVGPIRVISGSKTQLDWPAHLFVDPERGELYLANDGGNSVLVFHETDEGNVAPARVIQGPKTDLRNPTSLFVDTQHNELLVSNMGNHSATVYPLTANGNVTPLRIIRSAPADLTALEIGNPGAVAYDSKREQVLVPN